MFTYYSTPASFLSKYDFIGIVIMLKNKIIHHSHSTHSFPSNSSSHILSTTGPKYLFQAWI